VTWYQKTWAWIKKWWAALVGGAAVILGVLFVLLRRGGGGLPIGDVLKLQRETREIARKEGRAAELVRAADGREAEADTLRREVAESKRRVLEVQHGPVIKEMDDDQVADLFRRSGL
jgi:hypothetical protein